MSEAQPGVSRGQFFRNAAKGGLVLATSGGVLASVEGVALAAGPTRSDVDLLKAAYTAESLAVYVYSTVLDNFHKFSHPKLTNRDYFVAALADEKAHRDLLHNALGAAAPKHLKFKIPSSATKSGQALLETGVALETAFVQAYLGGVKTLSSGELKLLAAQIATNEATHFSFFDAAAGGHAVLPAVPAYASLKVTEKRLKPFLA